MKNLLIIILFSVLSLVNYARPPKMPKLKTGEWVEPVKTKNIYGNWLWIQTDCCGIRHGVSTPTSTSDNIELVLNSDNTFMETHTKINALPRSGILLLNKQETFDVIQFNDERPARYSLSVNSDTLTISWKYLELQTEKYLRK